MTTKTTSFALTLLLSMTLAGASLAEGPPAGTSALKKKETHYKVLFKSFKSQLAGGISDNLYRKLATKMLAPLSKAKTWSTLTPAKRSGLAKWMGSLLKKYDVADLKRHSSAADMDCVKRCMDKNPLDMTGGYLDRQKCYAKCGK